MKKIFVLAALLVPVLMSAAVGPEAMIPKPVKFETGVSVYTPKADGSDVRVKIGDKRFARLVKEAGLTAEIAEEAYQLVIGPKGIEIKALTDEGAFRAKQSLQYLLAISDDGALKECIITDWPRFYHRGIMLDISRNFRDKEFILKQIDALASVKINSLHLHLTDDAGWRIEIDKYPRLTEYAAWRKGKDWKAWRYDEGKQYLEKGDPQAVGGYLTKDDIREILTYAAERHMNIIPEIEMPGHSAEVLAAYPELACTDAEGNPVFSSDVCPSNEKVYEFFENVLDEVIELFPSQYIHIGGDEASKKSWKTCPVCQAKMKEEGLEDVDELQSRLVRHMDKYISSKGRTLVGWDEIMQGGLAEEATVMSWRGTANGLKAIDMGHDVIMSPNTYCYIDYYQDSPVYSPEGFGGYIPLKKIYSYNPTDGIDADHQKHLLGVQANLWTEFVSTGEHVEYMLYPRSLALAEVAWSPQDVREYEDFRERALVKVDNLRADGYNPFDLANEIGDRPESYKEVNHLARGCKVIYNSPYTKWYAAGGDGALTDGKQGGWTYQTVWQGFLCDMDVVVDLGEIKDIHYVGAWFLSNYANCVTLPKEVKISVSEDGENFRLVSELLCEVNNNQRGNFYYQFGAPLNERVRYVKVQGFRSDLPQHDFLFVDEIVIN